MSTVNYQIKLEQFEGPFDLLLFFIERDELDIYNIPITKIINDFLDFIHSSEKLNIELSSEFILFVSTLMRIKARLLLPRKEVDAAGNEIDPRQELIDKILEYKKFKEAAVQMAEMEAMRMLMVKRGNLQKEIAEIGEEASEGTEIQNITLFKLMKAFEKVMQRVHDRQNKPVHTVVRYNYTMEGSRDYMLDFISKEKTVPFEKIFEQCEDRIHALFFFLSLLELSQQRYMKLLVGQGMNNFIVEWNENREAEIAEEGIPDEINFEAAPESGESTEEGGFLEEDDTADNNES
ncbi:MAG: segregation/condensation protein A [Sediminibacterium sp.]|nr:segregation/condensation protein A [Sediminibacterium sp.]